MRIVIGEDSVLFREGLAALLANSGHDIVAKADDAPGDIRGTANPIMPLYRAPRRRDDEQPSGLPPTGDTGP